MNYTESMRLIMGYKVPVPVGRRGEWTIGTKTVTKDEADRHQLHAAINGHGRYTPPGNYTGLANRDGIVMSDAPDERRDMWDPVRRARGQVLINGLGLGLVAGCCLEKPEVDSVVVIEISQDVIDLVAPHYYKRYDRARLEIIRADALTYQPPKGDEYDVVWHDIWPDICSDHLPQMHTLHRKYGRRTLWQGSWCRRMMEQQRGGMY